MVPERLPNGKVPVPIKIGDSIASGQAKISNAPDNRRLQQR